MAPAALLGLRFLLGLGMLAVGPLLFWDLLVQCGAIDPTAVGAARLEASMLVFVLACACVVVFAWSQRPGLPWRPVCGGRVVASYVPFAVLWVAVLIGYLAAARRLGLHVAPQPALDHLAAADFARPGTWFLLVGTVVGAPLAEEIVFRGYLQSALATAMRPALAIGLTAVLFGGVHGMPYALPVALLGAFFGLLAHRCGSLWPAVCCHSLHNTLTVAVTVLWPEHLNLLYPR